MRFLYISIIIFIFSNLQAQVDNNGNPVFNSITVSEETYDNFGLTISYYNIKDNISNKETSVYLNDNPTPQEYLEFAVALPSYFFIVHQNHVIKYMIMPTHKLENGTLKFLYYVMDGKREDALFPREPLGTISEFRAEELLKLKIDPEVKIYSVDTGKVFEMNGEKYPVEPFAKIKEEVINLAKNLMNSKQKFVTIEDQQRQLYIETESVNGGKLDFIKKLTPDKTYNYDNADYNSEEYAVILWGNSVLKLGIDSAEIAINLWEEIYKTKMTETLKKALTTSFNKKEKK